MDEELTPQEMTAQQIQERLSAIAAEMADAAEERYNELETEAESLMTEQRSRLATVETRNARIAEVRAAVQAGQGVEPVRPGQVPTVTERSYDESSETYVNAWLRSIAVDARGNHMFGELTREERAAVAAVNGMQQRAGFTFTTENTPQVVPTVIMNEIWDLIEEQSPIIADTTQTEFVTGFGIPRRTKIAQGDAAKTAEGVANDDEQDEFNLLSLDGVEFKKSAEMTRKMHIQSIAAFKTWLLGDLSERLSLALSRYVYAQLGTADYGIDAANKLTGDLSKAEVLKIFSHCKGTGTRIWYANQETIWEYIAAVEDKDGRSLFIPNEMSDPVVAGRVFGAQVKQDDTLATGKIKAGIPKRILTNNFCPIDITPDIENKTQKRIWTAYSLFDAGLKSPLSMVDYTIGA